MIGGGSLDKIPRPSGESRVLAFLDFSRDLTAGDVASILGLIVAGITLVAAQGARRAAEGARREITKSESISLFSAAIATMEEIQRLHRMGSWNDLPERYGSIRRALVSILANANFLRPEQVASLRAAMTQVADMARVVDRWNTEKKDPPKVARMNDVASAQTDKLVEIMASITQGTER